MDEPPPPSVPVWDLPLRLFHWALVFLVAFQAVTGIWGGPAEMVWHGRAGLAILALVLFRLAWGFVGGRHARYTDFLRGPAAIIAYLKGDRTSSPGHTPLGGWSIMAMLAVLAAQAGTGLFANDDILFDGPLMHLVGKEISDMVTRYHYLSARALLVLVGLHLGAILVYRLRGDNLTTPMVTGHRAATSTPPSSGNTAPVMASPIKALIVLAIAAGAVAGIVNL